MGQTLGRAPRYREGMKLRWGVVAALFLVVGAVAWVITGDVLWMGVGVAFGVMFAVVATVPRDGR